MCPTFQDVGSPQESQCVCMVLNLDPVPPGANCSASILNHVDNVLSNIQEQFLCPMLVTVFLLAVAGNSLALYRFATRESRPWHPGVVFSAQLATSDLLYALTLLPLAAYFYPPKHWSYGAALCHLERFLFTTNLQGSTIFLACISLNRYMGVVHPFFTRSWVRPKHAWALSVVGWALAAVLAVPTLHFTQLQVGQAGRNCSRDESAGCTRCLSTVAHGNLEAYWAYSLALAVLGCGLPLLATLAAYTALVRALWQSPSITAAEKRRVVALVASGLLLYAISYVPYYAAWLSNLWFRRHWNHRCSHFTSKKDAEKALNLGAYGAYQVARGLVPLAMCVHPLIYMAVASSLGCCQPRPPGSEEQDKGRGQAQPLHVMAAHQGLRTSEPCPPSNPS